MFPVKKVVKIVYFTQSYFVSPVILGIITTLLSAIQIAQKDISKMTKNYYASLVILIANPVMEQIKIIVLPATMDCN